MFRHIIERLNRVTRRYLVVGAAESLAVACIVTVALFSLLALAEGIWYLSPGIKTSGLIVSLFLACVAGVATGAYHYSRKPDNEEAARMVERANPVLNDRLISAVQLGNCEDLRGQSHSIVNALVERVTEESGAIDFLHAVGTARLTRLVRIAYGGIVLSLLLVIILPDLFGSGYYRLLHMRRAYPRPNRAAIYTLVGDTALIRGEDFIVDGFVSGERYRDLSIIYRWDGSESWAVKPVDVSATTGDFSVTVEKPHTSFAYYLDNGSDETKTHRVQVIERPLVEHISVELAYPGYTGRENTNRDDNDGNIRALAGSGAIVRIRANKPLSAMTVHWSDSTRTGCPVTGDTGEFSFTVSADRNYFVSLTDTLGIVNANPITYRITALPDERPRVTIVSPPSDIVLPMSMSFPVRYSVTDDYGLTGLEMRFSLPHENAWRQMSLKSGQVGNRLQDVFTWDLSDLGLLPDDHVRFVLAARDNDTISGPKYGYSDTLTVRVPSNTELMRDMLGEQTAGIDRMREFSDGEAEKNLSLDDVRRNLINNDELDWTNRNTVENARKYLENMHGEMKALSEALDAAAESLSEEDMATLDTVEKYRQISALMDEIADGELKKALEQLTQMNLDIDPSQLKKQIDNFEITTEQLQEKLDRIVNLLEQVKALQHHDMVKRLLEEIAAEQAEVASKYAENSEDIVLSREQQRLAVEMAKLEEELTSLSDELAEKFKIDSEQIREFVEQNDISGLMDDAAEKMENGQQRAARESHRDTNMKLSELISKMDDMSEQLNAGNSQEMQRRLFSAMFKLLAVSEKQERLITMISEAETSSENVLTTNMIARIQMETVDALQNARESVADFTKLVTQLTGPLDTMLASADSYMRQAVDEYVAGNVGSARPRSASALRTLNLAVHFLSSLLENEGRSGEGMPGDMLQQLQQIANGQMSLNSMMSQSMSDEMMMQLAAQQQKLAEMLSELGQKILNDNRLREMLDGLTGDMDETADMMRRNDDRERIERQQLDIYRRLLDARRSRREKDQPDERRQSETAELDNSDGAEALDSDLGEHQRELNARIRQAMEDDFTPEYKRLIRGYFDSLLDSSEAEGER